MEGKSLKIQRIPSKIRRALIAAALDLGSFLKACLHRSMIVMPATTKGLLQAVDRATEMVRDEPNGGAVPVPDYADINVSDKVVKIIQSYVGVVK